MEETHYFAVRNIPFVLLHLDRSLLCGQRRKTQLLTQMTQQYPLNSVLVFVFLPSQDFVNHFHVLLPQGISPSKHNVHDFFRKIKLNPDNYQVGRTMVNVYLLKIKICLHLCAVILAPLYMFLTNESIFLLFIRSQWFKGRF